MFWWLLKRFFNNMKILIPPPHFHEKGFATDFKEKTEVFNTFFAKQSSLINDKSLLPAALKFFKENRLSTLKFASKGMSRINQNKAHCNDEISIRMLKFGVSKTGNAQKPPQTTTNHHNHQQTTTSPYKRPQTTSKQPQTTK